MNQQEGKRVKGDLRIKINFFIGDFLALISGGTFSTSMSDKIRSLKQPGVAAVVANASSGSSGRCTKYKDG